ncbi:MAG: ROK family protein [Planctomycetota bacterium]
MNSIAIGIDIGGSHISTALVNPNGKFITKETISFLKPPDGKQGIRLIKQLVKTLLDSKIQNLKSKIKPAGIGIACPGCVDHEKGVVLSDSPNLIGWKGTQVKTVLEYLVLKHFRLKIPVFVDNDANLAALGENTFGAGKNARNLICLTLGTGVGGGIIINNQIYHGSHFYAGEIGHMTISLFNEQCSMNNVQCPTRPNDRPVGQAGPICSCGKRGHLEALVSGPAIVREFTAESRRTQRNKKILSLRPLCLCGGNKELTAKMVFDAARKGDKIAGLVIEQATYYLGCAVSSLINTFDPEVVVIGGGIAQAGDILFKPLRLMVKDGIMPHLYRRPKVVPAKLGENAGLLGAAAVVFSSLPRRTI